MMIGIAFRVSWLCCLLIGGITCSTSSDGYPALGSDAAWLYAGSLGSKGYGNYSSPTAQMQAQLTEGQQKHPAAILQKQLVPMPQAPQKTWYPAQMPQKQPATELQHQKEQASIPQLPQQVWYPVQIPQQQKQPATGPQQQKELTTMPQKQLAPMPIPQKQPTAMPQQAWYPAPMPQKQPAAMPQQVWHPAQMLLKNQLSADVHVGVLLHIVYLGQNGA
eukprot:XP_014033992.1 PREDICTED: hydroxysteroid dehydrogenase-like protein 2 [Salmo salar]